MKCNQEPLVSIICDTYNHEKYLKECLDGFVMQKTDFKFEVLIHDDASTDGTSSIIREYEKEYPDIINPIYQSENKYSKGISIWKTYQFPRIKGKYVALCEGDDYWIDPLKLQKQVDFLEAHLEYGLVYTKAKSFIQKDKIFLDTYLGAESSSFNDLLYRGNAITTLTVCLRSYLLFDYLKYVDSCNNKWLLGDYPLWLFVSQRMKIKFFNDEITAVYRVLLNSASHSSDILTKLRFEKSVCDVQSFFCDKNNIVDRAFIDKIYLKSAIKLKIINRFKYRSDIISYLKLNNYKGWKDILISIVYFSSLIAPSILRWYYNRREPK